MSEIPQFDEPLRKAVELIHVKRYSQALPLLLDARRSDPTGIEPCIRMAQCLNALNRQTEALQVIEEGLALNPESAWGLRMHALTLNDLGRHQQARQSTDRALQIDPQEAMNYIIHTHTLLELKKAKVALPFAQRAVQLAPYWAEAHNAEGLVHLKLRRSRRASECFERALAISPNEPAYRNNVAATLMRRRRFGSAQKLLLQTAESDPTLQVVHHNLARNVVQYIVLSLIAIRISILAVWWPLTAAVSVGALVYGFYLFHRLPASVWSDAFFGTDRRRRPILRFLVIAVCVITAAICVGTGTQSGTHDVTPWWERVISFIIGFGAIAIAFDQIRRWIRDGRRPPTNWTPRG